MGFPRDGVNFGLTAVIAPSEEQKLPFLDFADRPDLIPTLQLCKGSTQLAALKRVPGVGEFFACRHLSYPTTFA